MTNEIKWNRSKDGDADSKCGKFSIGALSMNGGYGGSSVYGYRAFINGETVMNESGKKAFFGNQKKAKEFLQSQNN